MFLGWDFRVSSFFYIFAENTNTMTKKAIIEAAENILVYLYENDPYEQEEKDNWSPIEIDWSLTLSSIEVDLKEFLKRAKSRKK